MQKQIDTEAYNEKRYGKPWIAKLVLGADEKEIKFNFGNWIGDLGNSGLLVLELEVGDYFARGQKDFRRPRNSTPTYYKLEAEDHVYEVGKVEVYRVLLAKRLAERAERAERIEEI